MAKSVAISFGLIANDCMYYVKKTRKFVMDFIILRNIHFFKKTINKTEVHTEPEKHKVKNLITSKNITEFTNCERYLNVCVLQDRISYLLCRYCKYCYMLFSILFRNFQCFMTIKIYT